MPSWYVRAMLWGGAVLDSNRGVFDWVDREGRLVTKAETERVGWVQDETR